MSSNIKQRVVAAAFKNGATFSRNCDAGVCVGFPLTTDSQIQVFYAFMTALWGKGFGTSDSYSESGEYAELLVF